jgi:LacI family transcriptional regulator
MRAMSSRCTIHTVARAAKVSVATVSRVVNNPALVSPDKRWRVMEVMQKHNFWVGRPRRGSGERAGGRGPGARRALRFGFLVPDAPARTVEVFTEEMVRGAQKVMSRCGAELLLEHFPLGVKEGGALPAMLSDPSVKGFLVRPPPEASALKAMAKDRKVVVVGNMHAGVDLPSVLVDNRAGMELLMEHLFGLGHRRIAFVSGPLASVLNLERRDAYCMALLGKGLRVDPSLVRASLAWVASEDEVHAECLRLWEELFSREDPPTAIAASMDGIAAQMLRVASEKGVAVPRQVSIAGFGDTYYAAFTNPPITTVRVDHRAVGELGAHLLVGLVEGLSVPTRYLARPSLVVRESTAPVG